MDARLTDPDFTLWHGDVLDVLPTLPEAFVHCVVTSPPYWNLRSYAGAQERVWLPLNWGDEPVYPVCVMRHVTAGDESQHQWGDALTVGGGAGNRTPSGFQQESQAGQVGELAQFDAEAEQPGVRPAGRFCMSCGAWEGALGLEPTPELYVDHLVAVFREVRRVLRADGTLWLNVGDSYNAYNGNRGVTGSTLEGRRQHVVGRPNLPTGAGLSAPGLKPKDMVMIPARLALALQADGWWVRSDIIWSKPHPMPESVTDRPTKAHEYVFLLTKSDRYFYDLESIREEPKLDNGGRVSVVERQGGTAFDGEGKPVGRQVEYPEVKGANRRSVWEIGTVPNPEAHFAAFPPELPRRCIRAGTSEVGVCPECGAPWARMTERLDQGWDGSRYGERAVEAAGGALSGGTAKSTLGSSGGKLVGKTETVGWQPTCSCAAGVDLTPILTPLGEGGDDQTMLIGRRGLGRERGEGAGTRPMTRYEQQQYADALKASPARREMESDVGREAFAHYIRKDRAGARPVPAVWLERWIGNGWIDEVVVPAVEALEPVPAVVMDPFLGSGTTARVAREEGRRCVGVEVSEEYCRIIERATQQLSLLAS